MNLADQHPVQTYPYIVNTDGSKIYDGVGTQLTSLELTTSYALYQVRWEESSSYASSSTSASFLFGPHSGSTFGTASWAVSSSKTVTSSYSVSSLLADSSSYIWPSKGTISNMQNASGSSTGTVGFPTAAEMDTFILAVSQSFITLNDLLAKLRTSGIIS